jgi:hypothetical protein
MFQDKMSFLTSGDKQSKKTDCLTLADGAHFCPDTPAINYQCMRRNIPEQPTSQPQVISKQSYCVKIYINGMSWDWVGYLVKSVTGGFDYLRKLQSLTE